MKYMAILQTDDHEFVCLSATQAKAKQGVFDGYNTYLKKQFELENTLSIETTSEYLASRLKRFYKTSLGGDVSIDTLEKKWDMHILELEYDAVYRDGFKVPRREQDY